MRISIADFENDIFDVVLVGSALRAVLLRKLGE
ncbi:hypothetical protein CLV59_103357 [Chitinophaga dinghuensis]|uniref:Uncharacterized protein n=1 Tax=Chitinophaga dinghuensis TaxID=1539050 RepID=A0A327W4V1_9BACT|nr:hypothetical protein CLV59_103357 [Chitinophaga dinghuensis]